MAFQSSVLRDGEWVTQTVSFQDALKASSSVPKTASDQHTEKPACGILSRTIIESPVVHWVLPVLLRSRSNNDLAFIGVSYFPFRYVSGTNMSSCSCIEESIRWKSKACLVSVDMVFFILPGSSCQTFKITLTVARHNLTLRRELLMIDTGSLRSNK